MGSKIRQLNHTVPKKAKGSVVSRSHDIRSPQNPLLCEQGNTVHEPTTICTAKPEMFEPVRGGTRGGQAQFKWSDVSADKDREVGKHCTSFEEFLLKLQTALPWAQYQCANW